MRIKAYSLFLLVSLSAIYCSCTSKKASYEYPDTPQATFEYIYIDTLVTGGDGLQLVTRIYLPKGEGPWPVVITRSPYPQRETTGDNLKQGQQYVKHGLGYILQYCRGKGGSEGTYKPNIYEREDGLALVNWVAKQDWCGSIGLFGASYTALTSWIIADSLPGKVKGIYLHHYGVDRHLSAYKDGLFRQDILTGWAIDNANEIETKPFRDPDDPYYEAYRYMPQAEMDVNLLGAKLPWYRDWITHTDYNDPYWHTGVWAQLRSIPPKIKVPMTIVAGLFDHHIEGTIKGYELLTGETKKNSRLILGAWNHFYQITPEAHTPMHAKDVDVFDDQFNWLYQVVALGRIPKGEVLVYYIGADRWETYPAWPIPVKENKTYYLTGQKDKTHSKAYLLSAQKEPDKTNRLKFIYDPQNPVMSMGGETLFNSPKRRGSQLQPEVGYRDDILFFLTEPLTEPLTIAGPVKATIYMSSDCEDTSLTYKISEVLPDGSGYNIRSGITTLAYRNDRFGGRQTYTPHEIVELTVETLPVTWQIKPGSRLRLEITSSNFPEYSIHSNYPGIWSEQSKVRKANQTIYIGSEYPTHIQIPLGEENL
ncbi:CocE/NonD family hydrolase [Parabacteroides sp. PF5-9]|uniref:CocE/NonD family hydrolase n=1 Tax=Parabacteroides sp. PF5-9 TaxID=1742404 RepID=UPI0024768F27|nr:CocE/NonD family hydrolase [Parabacteroides sp. PF5-9]MDH6359089.1 putative CocE/NonD family hydrolase [Parabacteroides sp. PF5-9]